MGKVNSSLGLEDTLPFGKYKGQLVKNVYTSDANYLLWMRDAKANPEPNPDTGAKQEPNREFFTLEVLILLDQAVRDSSKLRSKYQDWGTKMPEPDDTPFEAERQEMHYYHEWGAF